MRVRTHRVGDLGGPSFVTKEYGLHGLAKESLTLFPDGVRCPLSSMLSSSIGVALRVLGNERELVGGC